MTQFKCKQPGRAPGCLLISLRSLGCKPPNLSRAQLPGKPFAIFALLSQRPELSIIILVESRSRSRCPIDPLLVATESLDKDRGSGIE